MPHAQKIAALQGSLDVAESEVCSGGRRAAGGSVSCRSRMGMCVCTRTRR
jgi:hypothetical protein